MSELPKMPVETLHMMRELAGLLVARRPMTPSSSKLLETVIAGQKHQVRLALAALAAHRVSRMADLVGAMDLCHSKMTDPEYISRLYEEPAELRRHMEALHKIHQSDVEFLFALSGEQAQKRGFSADPKTEYNFFFPDTDSSELPSGTTTAERRRVMHAVSSFMSLMSRDGQALRPPTLPSRVIDVPIPTTEVVEEEE